MLNRPAQFNALSKDVLVELQAALDAIAMDASARVVVIAGAGKAFCAGHDLKEMRAHPSKKFQQSLFELCSRVMMTLTDMPQPVIARVHGFATAAGCQLVAMCDLAVASEDARFAVSGINVGLFCSTPSVGLARNVGRKRAMEMLLTDDFIDAQTALERGLVNRVVPEHQLDAEVKNLIDAIEEPSGDQVRQADVLPAVGARAGERLRARERGDRLRHDDGGRAGGDRRLHREAGAGVVGVVASSDERRFND